MRRMFSRRRCLADWRRWRMRRRTPSIFRGCRMRRRIWRAILSIGAISQSGATRGADFRTEASRGAVVQRHDRCARAPLCVFGERGGSRRQSERAIRRSGRRIAAVRERDDAILPVADSEGPQYGEIGERDGELWIERLLPPFEEDPWITPARANSSPCRSQSAPLLAPVVPRKIVCIGRNYREHAAELGNEVPKEPLLFLKAPSASHRAGRGHSDSRAVAARGFRGRAGSGDRTPRNAASAPVKMCGLTSGDTPS